MVEAFLGKWKLVQNNSEDFNKYMEALNVSLLTRKAACALKPDVIFSMEADVITFKTESTFKSSEISFKLGEEFDETTADGRKTKTTVTLENGVLVQVQKWDGKETVINREVKDGELITTCIVGDVRCVRIYNRK
ncbi:fatty acid-binding protein, liver-like [Spea bombifrons]|uniref:fatty acid-binding protein, liver-like n=1 Tax=Spea bombifrons TaxID=233779 RepID=UPI00234BA32A|nr:fatty acid-binding protein, liver-like [Spea bombifrons]